MADPALSRDIYCVYEHWRPDTNSCFYVGKGKLRRARSFSDRNSRYTRIVEKLKRLGLKPEVRIILSGLTGDQAISAEVARIKMRRDEGCDIANYTDGGDGTTGYVHTEATKSALAAKAKGRRQTAESIAKMVAWNIGSKRSDETKAKQSASAKIAQKARFDLLKQTEEGRASLRLSAISMSRKAANDPAVRASRSANAKALWQDPDYRERMMASRASSARSRAVVKGFS